MPDVAKYVHDENIKKFREKLREEADPTRIRLLEKLIEEEEERYAATLRSMGTVNGVRQQHRL